MDLLELHQFHQARGARFSIVGGCEVVGDYGSVEKEYAALAENAGVLDLSFRGRLCLTGADRQRFLHGQVTNAVKDLQPGESGYAALVTAKGKLVSDLNVVCLRDELLLDFEPGYAQVVTDRLEKYVIADDVQVVNVAPHYSLLSVQGPRAAEVITSSAFGTDDLPAPGKACQIDSPDFGEVCCVNQERGAVVGFDLFIPNAAAEPALARLIAEAGKIGGGAAGWQALELMRVEAGLPRFGQDMDETNLAPEAGIDARAISYSKGCYIGQEVIARIRTYGQVARAFRGLRLPGNLETLPTKGARLLQAGKEVGYVTSAVRSPRLVGNIALGYVRKECNQVGTALEVEISGGLWPVKIVALPFAND